MFVHAAPIPRQTRTLSQEEDQNQKRPGGWKGRNGLSVLRANVIVYTEHPRGIHRKQKPGQAHLQSHELQGQHVLKIHCISVFRK